MRFSISCSRVLSALLLLGLTVCANNAARAGFTLPSGYTFQFTIGFNRLTSNSPALNNQFFVDLYEANALGKVLFGFRNTGPVASSITDIYFEDGAILFTPLTFLEPPSGVNYSEGASPGNLPGANSASPPFVATKGLTADSDPAVQPNGINPGEDLGVVVPLKSGKTFADVILALNRATQASYDPADHDGLRIGIRVQGLPLGQSDSYLNDEPPPPVPEPASILAWSGMAGLLGLARMLRKNRAAS